MSNDQPVIIEDLWIVKETPKAYLFKDDDGNEAWVPKSMVTRISKGEYREDIRWTEVQWVEMAEWIAREKGLL